MIAEIWSSVKGKPQGNFSRHVEAASLQYCVDQESFMPLSKPNLDTKSMLYLPKAPAAFCSSCPISLAQLEAYP